MYLQLNQSDMKKIIAIIALIAVTMTAGAQISGKYAADQFVNSTDTIFTSQSWPIEIGGENFSWGITTTWADSTVATTSTVKLQTSPDGSLWMDYATTPDSIASVTYSKYAGTDITAKWMKLVLTVTSGDTIYGFKAWYEFKRK